MYRRVPVLVHGDVEAVRESRATARKHSKRVSRCALNATNFFLAGVVTIVVPFLVDFLRENHWSSHDIGIAAGMSGLGVFLAIIPVGAWLERVRRRRRFLAVAGLGVGVMLGSIPLVPTTPVYISALMFAAGVFEAFLTPLLMALALAVASSRGFNRLLGTNQAWNHAGSIASALLALGMVSWLGLRSVFFCLTGASLLAAAACLAIRGEDLHEPPKRPESSSLTKIRVVLHEPAVRILLICAIMLHFANSSILPLVVLRMQSLGEKPSVVSQLILIAQGAMVFASYVAGSGAERWGRKPVMALAFCILPLRILLDAWVSTVNGLLWVQILDGMTFGIYSVVVGSVCADVAGSKGRFTTLLGIATSTQAFGAVSGPLAGGYLLERFDFALTFYLYAALAAVSAALFIWKMPETKTLSRGEQ